MRILLCFLFLAPLTLGYKILMFVPTISRSNVIFYNRIADLLVKAGHQVTLYRPHYTDTVLKVKSESAREVRVPGPDREIFHRLEAAENNQAFNDCSPFSETTNEFLKWFAAVMESSCDVQASNFEVLEQLRKEKFDLAFTNMYEACPFGLVHVLNITTHLYLSSTVLFEVVATQQGLPALPSFVPGVMTAFSDTMSYKERVLNFLSMGALTRTNNGLFKLQEKAFKKYYGEDFPSLESIAKKSQLLFINSEELIDFPRPILHKSIYIGGIGMKNPQPLPKKFAEIADKSQDGLILMSFGSVVNASDMPLAWKKGILQSFAQFPTYTFLLKYEKDDLLELPEAKALKNLHIEKWVPQTDLLGYPKTRAFITHAGYNSMLEAANLGVPFVCMPLFGDQFRNCKAAERHGFGIGINKLTANDPQVMTRALERILTDQSYTKTAKMISGMLRKKPTNSEELIVKWTEFLAEFKQIPNLQPVGAELGFFVYHSLDVIAGLVVVLVLVCVLFLALITLFRGSIEKVKRE